MATPRGNRDIGLKATLFDSTVIREAQEATEFLANVLMRAGGLEVGAAVGQWAEGDGDQRR